jgi:hypothetical protein
MLNEKLKVTAIDNIIISYIEKGDVYNPLSDKFDIKQTDDLDEEEYENNNIYISTSIFDEIKDAVTVYLYKKETTQGLAFEMTGEEEGAGFLLTFGKAKDTKIYCCDGGCSAINVHMNIEPVKIEIKKKHIKIFTNIYIICENNYMNNLSNNNLNGNNIDSGMHCLMQLQK